MTAGDWLLLLGAAVLGGTLNSLVGGGSFVTFPALLIAGVPAVTANATSTVALWPAVVASSVAFRKSLVDKPPPKRLFWVLLGASVVGGTAGSLILLSTSEKTFVRIIPWLLLVAAALFSSGPWISKRLPVEAASGEASNGTLLAAGVVQLGVAAYGGYFGGGMGILILALLSLLGMRDMHAMTGLRSILAVAINGAAIVAFVVAKRVDWRPGIVMVIAATTAGYVAAAIARNVPAKKVRWFVLSIAWAMTAYFFWRTYHK